MTHDTDGILPDEEASNLGTGLSFLTNWDFELINGSMELIEGIPILGRDLSWAVQQEMEPQRGQVLDADAREDIAIALNNIISDDPRVESISVESVNQSEKENRKVEAEVSIVAVTDEQADFIFRA